MKKIPDSIIDELVKEYKKPEDMGQTPAAM